MPNEKKSFKKFAGKHLAHVIETRRKTHKARAEKKERLEKKKKREVREAAKEEREHQADLEKLKDQDPEFYSYLEEDDPGLLQFGAMEDDADLVDSQDGSDAETDVDEEEELGDDDGDDEELDGEALERELAEMSDDDDDDDDDDGGANAGESARMKEERTAHRVTRAEIDEAIKGKKVVDAVNLMSSAVRQLGIKVHESRTPASTRKFDQPDLIKYAIAQAAKLTAAQLPNLMAPGKTPTFRDNNCRALVKRVVNASVAVMTESSADGNLCAQIAQCMASFVRVIHLIRGVTKVVLRAVLNLCTHAEETTRLAAYMVVLGIAKRAAGTRSQYQSAVFKGIFLSLVRTSHKYTIHTLPVIGFLMTSVVNLYATDMEAAYQHAYVYIRQLAVHLRAALQEQSQHNVRAVFNWQFLNALRCWGLLVSTYHEPNQLGPLIHPVVQIATGLLDLFSSPRMFPMHLHVIEMLNHISSRSGVYIPMSTYLMRILSAPTSALESAATAAAAKAADLDDLQFSMRVKKAHARTNAYKIEMWREALFLLTEHLASHSHTIGFPEAFWAVGSTLSRLKREVKVPKVHSQISTILTHVNATIAQTKARRDNANFGPCDVESVKIFEDEGKSKGGPLVTYYNAQRQQRVAAFAAKQKSLNERKTLEGAVEDAKGRQNGNGRGGFKGAGRNPKRGRD